MGLQTKSTPEREPRVRSDVSQIALLNERWRATRAGSAAEGGRACYVLSIYPRDAAHEAEARLAEMIGLVEGQGDRVVGAESHGYAKPEARMFIGSGVAARTRARAEAAGAELLVLDAELSPSQTRNLEAATGLPVSDREAVILRVFECHATTRRARFQVELAHLMYLRPRIRGIGVGMDQQRGGHPQGRGPGETASELLARRMDARIAELRRGLEHLKQSGAAQRKHREDSARVVLVGYTNAGKTSLMNALTEAGLSTRDRPFETLDTTSRALTRYGGDVLLSDTVGFIRRLPARLLASFESTLAEACEAALLLVAVDVSDPEAREHLVTTDLLLAKLGAGQTPRLVVFNKRDRLSEAPDHVRLAALSGGHPYVLVSSYDAADITALREQVLTRVRRHVRREVFVPYERTDIVRRIYGQCRVVESTAASRGLQLVLEGAAHVVDEIARSLHWLHEH